MPRPALLGLICALVASSPRAQNVPFDGPFPPSTALEEGVSPEALGRLEDLVQGLVADDEIVGAELLVVKNGRSVLHAGYGWRDREAQIPMEPGGVFCVRSMTKPLIGTAILMLVQDDLLELDTRVSEHLAAFDVEATREITVEQLLQHTSGLPMSHLLGRDVHELEGIQAVAALGPRAPLASAPGTAFRYSDQGTDTLTALVEVVGGMPAAEFVRTRILEPLGMEDSTLVLPEGDPLRARAGAKYTGARGAWKRYWGPEDPPLFPFFLGSQGLYSTCEDYALFLDLWARRGRIGRERVLGMRDTRKALTPGPFPLGGASGFPDTRSEYGYLMQLWMGTDEEGDDELVAFGHGGSDGTFAWAFPDQRAFVLFFTQSRANTTSLRVEEVLGELFLGAPFDPNDAAPPLEQFIGYYQEDEQDRYRAVILDGDDLAVEVLGKAIVPLSYVGDDRFKVRQSPKEFLQFERDASGTVVSCLFDGQREFRFEPSADLPSVEELAAGVRRGHGLDRLADLGVMRAESEVRIDAIQATGSATTWVAWPDRWRSEEEVAGEIARVAYDGTDLRLATGDDAPRTLEGVQAEMLRTSTSLARFGDWSRWYPDLEVIQRLDDGEEGAYLVRAGDARAPAATLYIEGGTGLVGRVDSMIWVEGAGRIGQRLSFGDYREVSGMQLPYRSRMLVLNPVVGEIEIVTTITEVTLGVEVPAGHFELAD